MLLIFFYKFLKNILYVNIYLFLGICSKRKTLLKTAAPSLNLLTSTVNTKILSSKKKRENDARSQRVINRSKFEINDKEVVSNSLSEIEFIDPVVEEETNNSNEPTTSKFVDVGVQTDLTFFVAKPQKSEFKSKAEICAVIIRLMMSFPIKI